MVPPGAGGMRVLYITYDGLTDPLGGSQVLPYLRELAYRGHRITVLSCEKSDRLAMGGEDVAQQCAGAGIVWRALSYHQSPPVVSTLYDLARMQIEAARLQRSRPFDLVHCRSYLPALAGLSLKHRFGLPFVFDMRGFWPEERVESGDWKLANPLFRAVFGFFKNREKILLGEAGSIISLTAAAASVLREDGHARAPISIIPCCVDFAHFQAPSIERGLAARASLGIGQDRRVLTYLGSLGGNHLLDEMLDFYREFRSMEANAAFLFITHTDPWFILSAARERGIDPEEIIVRSASRDEVPLLLPATDLGVAFKRPGYSALACSPTKLGEMLAAGIPVVANAGIGDTTQILADTGGGASVATFDARSYREAIAHIRTRPAPSDLRRRAHKWFDLDQGVSAYDRIYRSFADAREGQSGLPIEAARMMS